MQHSHFWSFLYYYNTFCQFLSIQVEKRQTCLNCNRVSDGFQQPFCKCVCVSVHVSSCCCVLCVYTDQLLLSAGHGEKQKKVKREREIFCVWVPAVMLLVLKILSSRHINPLCRYMWAGYTFSWMCVNSTPLFPTVLESAWLPLVIGSDWAVVCVRANAAWPVHAPSLTVALLPRNRLEVNLA